MEKGKDVKRVKVKRRNHGRSIQRRTEKRMRRLLYDAVGMKENARP
jgi:hypothetical protein